MEVGFKTRKLRRCYECFKEAQRKWGDRVAKRYIERVNILYHAKTIDDLLKIPPLKFHALKGDRKGQYAMILHDRTRMIVSLQKEKLKGSKKQTTVIRVEEVCELYGD